MQKQILWLKKKLEESEKNEVATEVDMLKCVAEKDKVVRNCSLLLAHNDVLQHKLDIKEMDSNFVQKAKKKELEMMREPMVIQKRNVNEKKK